ncbi:MAG TPA: carbon storage regulator CsrA [Thermoanaerobacterales bacterium]|nr:carbon storage regulator CsrA [Thermoanaerobacterales bacterium]
MLILTRKTGEGLIIGKDVIVKVFEIEGDRVKIGIEAPKELKILRLELYQEVSGENKKAIDVSEDMIDEFFKEL